MLFANTLSNKDKKWLVYYTVSFFVSLISGLIIHIRFGILNVSIPLYGFAASNLVFIRMLNQKGQQLTLVDNKTLWTIIYIALFCVVVGFLLFYYYSFIWFVVVNLAGLLVALCLLLRSYKKNKYENDKIKKQ